MDADTLFLIFYWGLCLVIEAVIYFIVSVGLLSMLVAGVVLGFAFAMTLTYVQERRESQRFQYGRH